MYVRQLISYVRYYSFGISPGSVRAKTGPPTQALRWPLGLFSGRDLQEVRRHAEGKAFVVPVPAQVFPEYRVREEPLVECSRTSQGAVSRQEKKRGGG